MIFLIILELSRYFGGFPSNVFSLILEFLLLCFSYIKNTLETSNLH